MNIGYRYGIREPDPVIGLVENESVAVHITGPDGQNDGRSVAAAHFAGRFLVGRQVNVLAALFY